MPELPEVETVRRGLAPVMENARFVSVEQRRADLRFPFPERFAERLTGRMVRGLGRRAKYLLADLDDGMVLLMHLGMSGSFRIEGGPLGRYYNERKRQEAHDHVVFAMSTGARIIYNDPRRFGLMDLVPSGELETSRHLGATGLEPLGNAFGAEVLARLLAGKTTSLKAALLDQRLIAGLGNIYVCEALWRARLSPLRQAGSIVLKDGGPGAGARRLADAVRTVLEEAIAAGGSSLRDHAAADGTLGLFQHGFAVYDREGSPCPRLECDGVVRRFVQAGRSTFHCPRCQR